MNVNNKKKSSGSISITNDLNEFKSQSAQEHKEFLDNYYKNKSSKCNKHELDSKVFDLNRKLTDNLVINKNKVENINRTKNVDDKMNTIYSMGSTVSSYLSSNLNKFFKNTKYSSDSSGVDILGSSVETATTASSSPSQLANSSSIISDSNEQDSTTEISTIDADETSYQDVELSSSPCLAISNRLDKIGSSLYVETNERDNLSKDASNHLVPHSSLRRLSTASMKISNTNNAHHSDDSSEDFIFLPDDRNIERFSVMSYEVLSKSEGTHIDYTIHIKEFIHMTLEEQGNKCANCNRQINNIKKARRCYYYGKLYCQMCHLNFKFFIPAKLIRNLNTKKYSISENARHILESVYRRPIFDIIYDNSELYVKSNVLNECRKFRQELEHLRWYLQTCQNINAKNTFIMYLWPDDYLFETIHLYSLFDLTNLKDVYNKLKSARDFGVGHVLKDCDLCVQKGFICEICKSDETIYPFQLDSVVQCPECGALSHKTCHANSNSCLKCQRLTTRQ